MTCWNMLKLLNRSQDSAPRADHRPRPHPLEVCTRISQKAQTIERPVAVSACVSHVSFWIALSCQVIRVIVLLPCQQNVCAKQWVWFRRLKDLQHAHFKNILEYIKCGFQHIFRMLGFTNLPISIIVNGFTHTNQTRSAPKSWCCMAGHIFWSRDPSACGPPALQRSLGTSCPVISSKVGAFQIQLFGEFDDIKHINIANIAWCS